MGRGAWKKGNFAGSASNWQKGYAGSQQNLTNGVNTPSKDPTQAAIAAQDAMLAGVNAAVTSGRWAQGLQKAGQAGWQAGMKAYAASGQLAQKAQSGAPHYAAFAQQYGSAIMGQVQSLPPRGPTGSNQQRSDAINNWAHTQRGKYRKAWRGGT